MRHTGYRRWGDLGKPTLVVWQTFGFDLGVRLDLVEFLDVLLQRLGQLVDRGGRHALERRFVEQQTAIASGFRNGCTLSHPRQVRNRGKFISRKDRKDVWRASRLGAAIHFFA
jgi:hypothetical protein